MSNRLPLLAVSGYTAVGIQDKDHWTIGEIKLHSSLQHEKVISHLHSLLEELHAKWRLIMT